MRLMIRGGVRQVFSAAALAMLVACAGESAPPPPDQTRSSLGLMTSLPLYWPLDANFAALVSGNADMPWQRSVLESRYELVLLDTLTPIPGQLPDEAETDPLAGLLRLAIIQPRGLSPADNVALDNWVRGGGLLFLALDPALTGDYDLALGDPRRPVNTALIPPVVARWGLAVAFDDNQDIAVREVRMGTGAIALALPGDIVLRGGAKKSCRLEAGGALVRCRVGKGMVTLLADAAIFEHRELAGDAGERLLGLLEGAFE
jgi:hypothetical protein